jgi:hypothetical protein
MNFELPEQRVNELKEIQAETGSESMKELFNNALTMLEWAIKEVKHGNEIAAVHHEDHEDKVYRVFITPLLERVAKKHRPAAALAHGARS